MSFKRRTRKKSSRKSSAREERGSTRRRKKTTSGRGKSDRRTKKSSRSKTEFIRMGSITKTKRTDLDLADELMESKQSFNVKIYLPKGTDELTLQNGDNLLVGFNEPFDNQPDFVLGSLSLMVSDNENEDYEEDEDYED